MVIHLYHGSAESYIVRGIAAAIDKGDKVARDLLEEWRFHENGGENGEFDDSNLELVEEGDGYVVYKPESENGRANVEATDNSEDAVSHFTADGSEGTMLGQNPGTDTDGGENKMGALEDFEEFAETRLSQIEDRADHDEAVRDMREYMEQNIRWADARAFKEEYQDLASDVMGMIQFGENRIGNFTEYMEEHFDAVEEEIQNTFDYIDFMNDEIYEAAQGVSEANDMLGREDGHGIQDILDNYGE
ncbi:hypothetical protein [Candidatus Nanohalococcus occultus]|uniref:hypothetical protein n=1 Tax=Candidatus Nanohalococcus occultus TaxID=2978047 RepID=UPI0039DF6C04